MDGVAAWWSGLDDASRVAFRNGGVVLGALVLGYLIKAVVQHLFVAKGLDRCLRFPWASVQPTTGKGSRPQEPGANHSALTGLTGWFFMLTVWAGTAWLIAGWHGYVEAARAILLVLLRSWQVAVIVLPVLIISGWLARTLYDLLHTPWLKGEMDALFPGKSEVGGSFSDTMAKGLCVVLYAAFFLLIPVGIAALFNLSALQGLVVPAWQICARLLTALVVFAVGYLGVAWARAEAKRLEAPAHDETEAPGSGEGTKRPGSDFGNQLGLIIVVATVVLALGMVVGVSGLAGALVILVLFGILLWPARSYVRDLSAGVLLRIQHVKQGNIDGAPADVKAVTPLTARIEREGIELTRRNWEVLTASMTGTPSLPSASNGDSPTP